MERGPPAVPSVSPLSYNGDSVLLEQATTSRWDSSDPPALDRRSRRRLPSDAAEAGHNYISLDRRSRRRLSSGAAEAPAVASVSPLSYNGDSVLLEQACLPMQRCQSRYYNSYISQRCQSWHYNSYLATVSVVAL